MFLDVQCVGELNPKANAEGVVPLLYRGVELKPIVFSLNVICAGAYQQEASRGKTAQALKTY